MHLDCNDLPMQSDGDRQDQLQRVGMILVARLFQSHKHVWIQILVRRNWAQLVYSRGIYVRHVGGSPHNVSCDQLLPVFGFLTISKFVNSTHRLYLNDIIKKMFLRLGFAQNFETIEGKPKVPDFMFIRVLPFLVRYHPILYPLAFVFDLLLIPMALASCLPVWADDSILPRKRSLDDVDHNNLIITLLICRRYLTTPLSMLAYWLMFKVMPTNYGVTKLGAKDPVRGSLMWYHRAESGGNPEVAEMIIDLL